MVAAGCAPSPRRAVSAHPHRRAEVVAALAATLSPYPEAQRALAEQCKMQRPDPTAGYRSAGRAVGKVRERACQGSGRAFPAHRRVRRARVAPAPDAAHAPPRLVEVAAADRLSVPPCASLTSTAAPRRWGHWLWKDQLAPLLARLGLVAREALRWWCVATAAASGRGTC